MGVDVYVLVGEIVGAGEGVVVDVGTVVGVEVEAMVAVPHALSANARTPKVNQ